MFKRFGILLFLLHCFYAQAQTDTLRGFNKLGFTVQYAGSTGFMSTGFSIVGARNKIELGMLYGYLPASMGGVVHTATFKFTWDPFGSNKKPGVYFEPLQLGVFASQSFAKNLDLVWGPQFEQLYYWWPRALRIHPFLSTRLAWYMNGNIDHISFYFEANTNDLYLSSYFSNKKTIKLYDIVFFGAGVRLCFH